MYEEQAKFSDNIILVIEENLNPGSLTIAWGHTFPCTHSSKRPPSRKETDQRIATLQRKTSCNSGGCNHGNAATLEADGPRKELMLVGILVEK